MEVAMNYNTFAKTNKAWGEVFQPKPSQPSNKPNFTKKAKLN